MAGARWGRPFDFYIYMQLFVQEWGMANESKNKPAGQADPEQDQADAIAVPDWYGQITVDLSSWDTMQPILNWQAAARQNDLATMIEIMATVIVKWQYDHDPRKVASYSKISPGQWREAADKVGESVGRLFRQPAG